MRKYTFNWIWSTMLVVMISIVMNFSWCFFFSSFSRSCGPSDTLVGPSFLGRLFLVGCFTFHFCVLTSSKVTNPPQILVYCIPEPVQKKTNPKKHIDAAVVVVIAIVFLPRGSGNFFPHHACHHLVERPYEEHVRNLSACTRLTAKAFLSVSMWLIDLVIVIATVDISTRFSLDKTSDHSLFQFSIDVDPAFFRGWHNSFLRNSNRVEYWVIQYDNLRFKHLQVNNIKSVSKKYMPCIHHKL